MSSNTTVVVTIIVISGILVAGLALWLGPDNKKSNIASDTSSLNEQMPAPLSEEDLKAYQVSMTNEKNPIARFTTNYGNFEIELFEDTMPITSANFIKLAEDEFYNNTKFHRVIENFMIQGGDPNSKTEEAMTYGKGGPGYAIPDEHINGEYLTNIRGTISMANSGPNSGGSQFFINTANNTNLDFDKQPLSSKHPVFGHVISGMDVVDKISITETNYGDMPLEPVIVESIVISRP